MKRQFLPRSRAESIIGTLQEKGTPKLPRVGAEWINAAEEKLESLAVKQCPIAHQKPPAHGRALSDGRTCGQPRPRPGPPLALKSPPALAGGLFNGARKGTTFSLYQIDYNSIFMMQLLQASPMPPTKRFRRGNWAGLAQVASWSTLRNPAGYKRHDIDSGPHRPDRTLGR